MLKRDITYTNPFTEQEVTETHYFHISKADLVRMQLEEHKTSYHTKDGQELTGMHAKLMRILESEDGKAIMEVFEDLIQRSYGIKDGERFRKTAQIWEDFRATEAYSQLFFELTTNAELGAEFFNGVVPHNLDQIAMEVARHATDAAADGAASVADPTGLTTPTPEANADAAVTEAPGPDPELRKRDIANATSENPVVLTRAELTEMDHQVLTSGLADGRFKLS